MIRIVAFLVAVVVVAAVATWISEPPGRVEIAWGDYAVETSPGIMAAFVAAAASVVLLIAALVRFVWIGPRRIALARRRRRERLGYRALTQGLVAAAAGDPRRARRFARRARHAAGRAAADAAAVGPGGAARRRRPRRARLFRGDARSAGDGVSRAARPARPGRAHRRYCRRPRACGARLRAAPGDSLGAERIAGDADPRGPLVGCARHGEAGAAPRCGERGRRAPPSGPGCCSSVPGRCASRARRRRRSASPTRRARRTRRFCPRHCSAPASAKERGRTAVATRTVTEAWRHCPHPRSAGSSSRCSRTAPPQSG